MTNNRTAVLVKPTRKFSLLSSLAVLFCSTAMTLLAIEIFMRIRGVEGIDLTYKIEGIEFDLSRLKIRDYYQSAEKGPETWRMLIIGDSFTYGAGVSIPETFAKKTESRIRKTVSENIEVWNCGFPGWNTEREVEYLEKTGMGYSPDMVTICFYLNDATDWGEHEIIFSELYRGLKQQSSLDEWSFLYRFIHKRILSRQITRKTTQAFLEAYYKPVKGVDRWALCKNALIRARNLCDAADIPFTLMIFPILVELNDKYPFQSIHDTISAFCTEAGIPVLDLLPAFKGQDANSLRCRINDAHPNSRGHDIAADALYDWLILEGFLREHPDAPKDQTQSSGL